MRTHHALQPRTPEQASYSIGRRDGKQFLKLYRSYLHGSLAGAREPVYEGTVVEDADDWRLTAVLALAPMTLAFAYLIVMLFSRRHALCTHLHPSGRLQRVESARNPAERE